MIIPTGENLIVDEEKNLPTADSKTNDDGEKVMPLFDHLAELRARLISSCVAVLVLFLLFLLFSEQLLAFLRAPLEQALPAASNALHFTSPLEVFLANLKVSFLTALVCACPVWLFHFWRFLAPGLLQKERRYVFPFMLSSIALFLLGTLFCFYVILPLALDFLITIGLKVGTPIITVADYVSMLVILIFAFALIFETPLILVLLGIIGLIDSRDLRAYRKLVLVGIIVLAALLTPPDPISQIGLALPVYAMYELAIIILAALEKKTPSA